MEHRAAAGALPPAAGDVVTSFPLDDRRDVPRRARRAIEQALASQGLDLLADDAGTVATELVTNALLHGSGPASLTLRVFPDKVVRVEVTDASPALPVRTRQDGGAMTGRGLALVGALSERWGVQRHERGKTVWAELRPGGETAFLDVDPDELLASWPDLDELEAWAPDGEQRYTVHLGDVPTDLLLAAKRHVDNLVREFALAAAGARTGSTAEVPAHLAELIDTVVHRFAEPRDAIKRQALAAAHAGDDHVRLELRLPATAAEAGEEYLRALDEADAYCRAARLLTLESPPQHKVFRRWYVEELVAQLRAAAAGRPAPPSETFEQRLLHEIDTLSSAERQAERTARLQRLSSALASAATPERVTHALLGEGAEALRAAGGAVLLSSGASRLRLPGAVGYADAVLSRLRAESVDEELPAAMALRTGEAVWLESREERDRRFPALASMEPDTVAMCAVPLVVGGRSLGALRFSFTEPRLFDEEERAFVQAMATLTAQALDRAQLYAQRIEISELLQRSLLPPRLPHIPGMRIRAAYQPVGGGVVVGGDFYDVWPCGMDRWAFAIGDASGTGPEAAAMTAVVRHTLRALTPTDLELETVLRRLDRALRDAHTHADDQRFCTVLLGVVTVHPDHAAVELAAGGHPGPVLARADEEPREVELRGSLLGLLEDPHVDVQGLRLRPGDELLLYTDGVTDARVGEAFFGLEGVLDTVRQARRHGEDTVAAVGEAVRRHTAGRVGDDVALLSLRFDGPESGMGIEPT